MIIPKIDITYKSMFTLLGINSSKYYAWKDRKGTANNHYGKIAKENWLSDWEKEAIINYAKKHIAEGYRRLTYMMMDEDIVAVSSYSTYRIFKAVGLLNRWNLGNEAATLVNEVKERGRYTVQFDASKLSSGAYLYSLVVGDYKKTNKMILTK